MQSASVCDFEVLFPCHFTPSFFIIAGDCSCKPGKHGLGKRNQAGAGEGDNEDRRGEPGAS